MAAWGDNGGGQEWLWFDWETEKRQLDVVGALDRDHDIDLVSTFMAAHAVPPEYKGRSQEYLELIVEEMLPR